MIDSPVTGRRIKRRTINYIAIGVAVVAVVFVVIKGTTSGYQQAVSMTMQKDQAALKEIAQSIADKITSSLEDATNKLDTLAQQEDLITLFGAGDKDALATRADELTNTIPAALKLRFLLPGQYEMDREAKPPLGFASLALLKKAEKQGKQLPAELHGLGSADAHIVMIRQVLDTEEKLVGLIHLSLAAEPVLTIIKDQDVIEGSVELVQMVGNKPLVLNEKGDGKSRQGDPVSVKIAGTHWQVNYWLTAGKEQIGGDISGNAGSGVMGLAFKNIGSTGVSPAMVLVIVIIGAVGFFLYRRKQDSTDDDEGVVYEGAVKAIMEGQHPGLEKLVPDLPRMGQSQPIKPVSQGLEGDDITKIQKPVAASTSPKSKPKMAATGQKPVSRVAGANIPEKARKIVRPIGESPPTQPETPKTDSPPAEEAAPVDMSLEFELPGAGSEPAESPPAEDTGPEDMSLEFELPGAGTEPAESPPAGDTGPEDMSLEFELPGAESEPAESPPAEETGPEDMSLEFELPGTENSEEKHPIESSSVPPAGTGSKTRQPDEQVGQTPVTAQQELSPLIFRAYDIRGIVGETLTTGIVQNIGQAIGSEAGARSQKRIVVGRDGRTSSLELAEALTKGLRASGCDVIDIGMVPTPVLYFATHQLETYSGVMITGSHNGPAYNGLKIMLAGETLASDAIQALLKRIQTNDMESGKGGFKSVKVTEDYIRRITDDIPVALGGAFKIVIDCGNGVAGMLAPQLFKALGHEIVELYCEVDGTFPNHHPDPSQPENLEELIAKVKQEKADLGLAFDGDGDRLGVVDGDGNIIWPDRQMMLMAKDVLQRNQSAPIIFDVKCSRHLKTVIEENGGKALMWKTGHSLIKAKMKEVNAPLAGEMSGHIFFKERWYGFDDALYAGARLVEILVNRNEKPAEVFSELPGDIATPELRIMLAEKEHAGFMQMLTEKMSFEGAEINKTDGVRVDFPDGWGLIRPSNTTPCLVARFEAENDTALQRIQSEFHALIQSISPDLKLPF